MSAEHMSHTTIESEQSNERNVHVIGRLGDIGLGAEDGIPSHLATASREQLEGYGDQEAQRLVTPTDMGRLACIDGRETLENVDGSNPEVRLRRVGGTASNLGVALNAEASVIDTIPVDIPLSERIMFVDEYITDGTGFERSAHLGGCGGANGEIEDNEAIHHNPAVMAAVKALMEFPEVREYLEAEYDEALAEHVRANAAKTAEYLRASGWNGQAYVDSVKEDNPGGVEVLAVDHDDEKYHGHKEPALVIVIGDETVKDSESFVWNLAATKKVAEALAGQRGHEGYTQALIADIAKHMAVAVRLPSKKTPVILIS
jgi:hypothetical protein